MKILFIAMTESIHVARWISLLPYEQWDIHLYPAARYSDSVHTELWDKVTNYNRQGFVINRDENGIYRIDRNGVKIYREKSGTEFIIGKAGKKAYIDYILSESKNKGKKIYIDENGRQVFLDRQGYLKDPMNFPGRNFLVELGNLIYKTFPFNKEKSKAPYDFSMPLTRLIRRLKPDIIHSLETQAAGYEVYKAKKEYGPDFPTWIHSIWGSDLYLYGRLEHYIGQVAKVVSNIDYLVCEGKRDIEIAEKLGMKGSVLMKVPGSGGFDIEKCSTLRQGKPSERKYIMLKGYQGWAGRSLTGLRALERCADALKGYKIILYVTPPDVEIAAELFTKATSIETEIVPLGTTHEKILEYQGKSRLSIGLSISDGLPNSLLESMVMGAFPIQSYTSHAHEVIEDGKNGLLVHPEDPDVIEKAVRRALKDDDLVNSAAEMNYRISSEMFEKNALGKYITGKYEEVYMNSAGRARDDDIIFD